MAKKKKVDKKQHFKGIIKGLDKRAEILDELYGTGVEERKAIETSKNFEKEVKTIETPFLSINQPSEIIIKGGWFFRKEVYVITNLALYDLQGEPIKIYSEVQLDAERYKDNWSLSIDQTQDKWIEFYDKKKGKVLPSLPLLYAITKAAKDSQDKNSVARDLLKSLKEDFRGYLVTSSRFDFDSQTKIYHDFGTKEQIELIQNIPELRWSHEKLSKLVEDPKWENPLRALFMTKDVKKIPEVLGIYGIVEIKISDISDRIGQNPIFLSTFGSNLNIDCDRGLFDDGYSRGVQVKISYDETKGVQNE